MGRGSRDRIRWRKWKPLHRQTDRQIGKMLKKERQRNNDDQKANRAEERNRKRQRRY